jgi:hypothetical protein
VRLHIGERRHGLHGTALGQGGVLGEERLAGPGEGRRLTLVRSVYVPDADRWVPVQEQLTLARHGGSVTWLIPSSAADRSTRLAIVFGLPGDTFGGDRRFIAYGALERRELAYDELAGLKAAELVVGGLARRGRTGGRAVIRFPGVGTLINYEREFVLGVEQGVDTEAVKEKLAVRLAWSTDSAHEAAEIDAALLEAEQLAADLQEGRAMERLESVIARYKPEKEVREGLAARIAAFRARGAALLEQAAAMKAAFEKDGDPIVGAALRDFLTQVKGRFAGADAVVAKAESLLAGVAGRSTREATQAFEDRVADALRRGAELVRQRRYASAYLIASRLLEETDGGTKLPDAVRRNLTRLHEIATLRLQSSAALPRLPERGAEE